MEVTKDIKKTKSKMKKRDTNLYFNTIINKKVVIPINNVGRNIKSILLDTINSEIAGKCIAEGYIKPESIEILTYSNGVLNDSNVIFEVVIECLVCNPSEGQIINCIVKNITKAGIRAEIDDINNPLIIFIARDHNYLNKDFSQISLESKINCRVIGQRFELNDLYISIIAELEDIQKTIKPKLTVSDDTKLDMVEKLE